MSGDGAAPKLLVAFCGATLAMVLALVVLLRGSHEWVDFVAIALLVFVAAALLLGLFRELDAEEQPGDGDDADPRSAGR